MANSNEHHLLVPVRPAQISWRDGQPYSEQFNDVYFSRHNGLREAEHVFIRGNRLRERWGNLARKSFVLAETGFGSGLNFMVASRLWLALTGAGCTLHYHAVEKHPLTAADMRRVHRLFAVMMQEEGAGEWPAESLLEAYPPLTPGFHRLCLFGGRVSLTLAFTGVECWLNDIRIQAEAWFLDGFAPARNADMWTPAVLAGVKENTASDGTMSTFTAAGAVRRGLEAAGFEVARMRGYGPKREMLTGVHRAQTSANRYAAGQKPWFLGPLSERREGASVTVVGAGLSGAFTADALARRGWRVTVIERHPRPAQEASGNDTGIIFSKLSAFAGLDYVFYHHSYLHAIRHLPGLLPENGLWEACGVLQLGFDDKERSRQRQVIDSGVWPPEVVCGLNAERAGEVAGVPLPTGGLFFGQAGWLAPRRVCEYLLSKHSSVQLLNNTEALRLERSTQGWRIMDAAGHRVAESDAVVLATAADTVRFEQTAFLPLSRIRGQVTPIAATAHSPRLRTVICYDGYITPAVEERYGLGATFSHGDDERNARLADDRCNLQRLHTTVPSLCRALCLPEPNGLTHAVGRAAFRCHTPDYLPVVGPVPDVEAFHREYAPLRKGQLMRAYRAGSYLEGLYVNVAHGSRGVTTTPLCAEIIAAYLSGEPQPVGEALRQALHPARFLIRELVRNNRTGTKDK